MVFIDDGTQLLVGYQQLGTGILHHEVQALLRIGGVQRLIGTTGLHHTQRGDRHPLRTGNQHRYHILYSQALRSDITCDTVADVIYLSVGKPLVLIHHGDILWCGLSLTAEQRHDGLRVVIINIVMVERVEYFYLICRCNIDVAQVFFSKESLHHRLVALQILADQSLAVLVAVVLGLHLILAVQDKGLQIERSLQCAVAQADGLHGFATQLFVGEHHAVPGKHRVALDAQIVHGIAKGVCLMFTHPAHLVLSSFQIVEHLGVARKLGIHRQRLHRHTHGVQETLVGTSVVDGGEQRLLFVVVSGQQETVGRCKEIALEDTLLLTESIHLGHVHVECPHHRRLAVLRFLQVGYELCETVAAVEVLGIPLLAFVEGRRLAQFCLGDSHFGHCHRLGLQCFACVGLLQVAQHHLQRGAVTNEVVDIQEEIEMLGILQQADVEQTVLIDVERHDEIVECRQLVVERLPFKFKIVDLFNVQFERLRIVDGLQGVSLLGEFDACEQRRVCCHSSLNGLAESLFVERTVEHI